MKGNFHVRCRPGEKLEITSKAYLSVFTRQVMERFVSIMPRVIYIDAGNESVKVPNDWTTRPRTRWTEEEIEEYKNSGWSGQVVTGYKWNTQTQPTVGQVFPDILEDTDTIKPSSLSCSEVSSSDPQRLIVNKTAALAITGIVQAFLDDSRYKGGESIDTDMTSHFGRLDDVHFLNPEIYMTISHFEEGKEVWDVRAWGPFNNDEWMGNVEFHHYSMHCLFLLES